MPHSRMTQSKKTTKLLSSKFDDSACFSEDKSVHLSYPVFTFEPSNKELLLLIEKAQEMKTLEDIDNLKENKRKSKFNTRNMMRVDQRSSSSMSHYSKA